jgi:hypothetical protein
MFCILCAIVLIINRDLDLLQKFQSLFSIHCHSPPILHLTGPDMLGHTILPSHIVFHFPSPFRSGIIHRLDSAVFCTYVQPSLIRYRFNNIWLITSHIQFMIISVAAYTLIPHCTKNCIQKLLFQIILHDRSFGLDSTQV